MRLAVVSDIHGNLPALRAVLAAIDSEAPDAVWYAGDFVGYGPWPEECVRLIHERGFPSVIGNYDEKTLKYPAKARKWAKTKDPRKLAAFHHASDSLSPTSRAYLAGLPETVRADTDGCRLLMVHSAPDSPRDGISPLTAPSRLRAIARDADADVIITGHTHWPFVRTVEDVLFVNAGSAGRPGDGDTRAAYVLIDLPMRASGNKPVADIRRVAYPVEEVIAALPRTGLAPEFAELYRTGRAGF